MTGHPQSSEPDAIAAYWARAARGIHWISKPVLVCDEPPQGEPGAPRTGWFADGVLNGCFNALDRHVALGRADETALRFESASSGVTGEFSYADLTEQAAKFAGVLRALGVHRGDRVLIVGPSIVEVAVAMLATARLGAAHCVVCAPSTNLSDAVDYLRACIEAVDPIVVVSAPEEVRDSEYVSYKPALDAALLLAPRSPRHVVVRRPGLVAGVESVPLDQDDLDYRQLMRSAAIQPAECVAVASADPARLLLVNEATPRDGLYVRETGAHAVTLRWAMRELFGRHPHDVSFAAAPLSTDLGQSFGLYAALFAGVTSVIGEDRPPRLADDRAVASLRRLVARHGVSVVIAPAPGPELERQLAPTDAWSAGPGTGTRPWRVFVTGPATTDPSAIGLLEARLGVPVRADWGLPETGWPILAENVGLGTQHPATFQEGG